jgi:methionyl-tRNA formyltransferase
MRILFVGTSEFGLPALRALTACQEHELVGVITQPDRPAGRGMENQQSPIAKEALSLRLKIFKPDSINAPSTHAQIRFLNPQLIVVAAYGQILKKETLHLPIEGCINIHASLLPRHRGATPIQSAILAGDRHTGITIMWMDEGLDTGPILLQKETLIRYGDTAKTLHNRLAEMAPDALLHALELIKNKQAPRIPQDPNLATLTKPLKKSDGLIDWTLSQEEIDRHIRAMNPWPGAFTHIPLGSQAKRLKIFQTIISHRSKGQPGEILRADRHGILVACGRGGLLLREVQLEGRNLMSAAELARGLRLKTGIQLF